MENNVPQGKSKPPPENFVDATVVKINFRKILGKAQFLLVKGPRLKLTKINSRENFFPQGTLIVRFCARKRCKQNLFYFDSKFSRMITTVQDNGNLFSNLNILLVYFMVSLKFKF